MSWNDLSVANRAKYIRLGVKSGITDLDVIRSTYNTYAGGGYTESGTRNNIANRARVEYYDPITGESYGSTLPRGKVRVGSFSDLTPEAQDEYMRNHPTTLPDVVVTPKQSIEDIVSGIFSKENWDAHKEEARELASFIPFIGDGLDIYDIGKSLYNGDYKDALLATVAFALPFGIDKAGRTIIRHLPTKGWDKRIAEVAMRTTDNPKPLESIIKGYKDIKRNNPERYKQIKNYILYNSTEGGVGRKTLSTNMVLNLNTGELEPWINGGINGTPSGFNFIPDEGFGDLIDAGLYGTPVDPRLARLESKGSGFGIHKDYVARNYKNRSKDIGVYRVNDSELAEPYKSSMLVAEEDIPYINILSDRKVESQNYVPLEINGIEYQWNPGGHRRVFGNVPDRRAGVSPGYSRPITYRQDIYKFLPDDYKGKWGIDGLIGAYKKDGFKGIRDSFLMDAGLKFVDKRFTPSIVKGNYYFND